jgi:hypothetical protein
MDGINARKLYGYEEKPGLLTSNVIELRCQLESLNASSIHLVEEPWYGTLAPYHIYLESALYTHKNDILVQVLRTDDGCVPYRV